MIQTSTILIVDDEEKIVDVIKSYLEKEGYKVVVAYSGSEGMEIFNKYAPNLVVMDLVLPDISGEELCISIRKKSRVPIIILTAKKAEYDIIYGLKIGADDYVTKPFSPRQLVARIEAILRRVTEEAIPLSNEFSYNDGELILDGLRHEVRKNGELVSLTPNEFKILMTMAKYPTKVFTREELITYAIGDEFKGYDRVVDTHIKNIRQKIGDDGKSPNYIITVHGVGYKFGGNKSEV